jgi:hypothetical protein
MDPSTLRRAMRTFIQNKLDHLALWPRMDLPGFWLNICIVGFIILFENYARPWKVKNPRSKAYIGIGAFNIVKADVYGQVGTHRALKMRPDDDMKLGKLIKIHGFKQAVLNGGEFIRVEWYDSLKALVNGLMKNTFAGVEYHFSAMAGATLLILSLYIWPFLGLFLTGGKTQVINLLSSFLLLAFAVDNARIHRLKPLTGLGFPLAVLIFIYIFWKATLSTLIKGGIDWRGTFYSLEELRRNKV